ncbi:MAG TPA: triose-phosphate isomerase [Methanothrix sp.]|jgi:triosephosphate isomerase|nr:triose-phosphate isomerase [Methanothrix sp.]HPC88983.1 triose-phosphate isomerase [Methanothrix sp.]HQE86748.1 triose-phosphate isomerase [Methanothrix sp.]HQI67377.1 triose-phosphate isomerase [Methanothrix sp.]HRS84613.1 triose-phosphate isomerase [Methanothrix sp.]
MYDAREIMATIVLNFKTYSESTGAQAVRLARICEDVGRDYAVQMIVVPQVADISAVASAVKIPVYSQHVDGVGFGGFTGHVTAACLAGAGAKGSLINHSERRLELAEIEASISACRQAGLKSIVCTNNVATTRAAAALRPDWVAVEPPELIGSGIPVSKADPDVVINSVKAVKGIAPDVGVLCGAGITRGEDLKSALELGTEGVLLASGIIKAKDQRQALLDLVAGAGK